MQVKRQNSKPNLSIRRKSSAIGYIQFAPQSQKSNQTITIEVGLLNNTNTQPYKQLSSTLFYFSNDNRNSRSASSKQFKTEISLLENSISEIKKAKPLASKKISLKNDSVIFHPKITETDTCYDTVNYQLSPVAKQEVCYYENLLQSISQKLAQLGNYKNLPKGVIQEIQQQFKDDCFLRWQASNQLTTQLDGQLQEYKRILAETEQELISVMKQKQNLEKDLSKFKLQHSNCHSLNIQTFNQAVSQIEEQKEIIILLQSEVKEVKQKCLQQKQTIQKLRQPTDKENLQCFYRD